MARRGPVPKSSRHKTARGNPGKRPLRGRLCPRRGRPKCPAWLSDEAKRKWRAIVPELDRLGLLTLLDGEVLAVYCQAWAEYRLATETLAKEGRVITGANGSKKPHPCVAQQRTAARALKDFAALLGLDPLSRTRLEVEPAGEAPDELELFLDENPGNTLA
jgi:P27 family predicted phage terminase small subunit